MIQVRCMLCLEKELEKITMENFESFLESRPYDISSNLITKSFEDSMQALGIEMLKHVEACHREEITKLQLLVPHFAGFHITKLFETKDEDSRFEEEKEKIRDKLCEEVMRFAPEEEFEDEDEDLEPEIEKEEEIENAQ